MKLLSLKKLWALQLVCIAAEVRYGWGAKTPLSVEKPKHRSQCDCSGHFRWLIHRATDGETTPPDGSVSQRAWCEEMGFTRVPYHVAMNDVASNNVYACFFNIGGRMRHVWIVQNGRTRESYGGVGVGCRWAGDSELRDNVQVCYRIA